MFAFIRRYVAIPALFLMLVGLLPLGLLTGCKLKSCSNAPPAVNPLAINCGAPGQLANINVWYLFEDPGVMQTLASQFKASHPYAEVTTIPFESRDSYLKELGRVSGSPQAPDVYVILNDWLPLYRGKLMAMPEVLLKRPPDISEDLKTYLTPFPPAVTTDLVYNQVLVNQATGETKVVPELYGLPWASEGLALYVNTNDFKEYNRANPTSQLELPSTSEPMSWATFASAAQKLVKTTNGWAFTSESQSRPTTIDPATVVRYGAALGYGAAGLESNVDYGDDIFTALLMQNEVPVVDAAQNIAVFNESQYLSAATNALESYTSYSGAWGRSSQGWPNSMRAFAEGRVSMAFGRSFQAASLPSSITYEIVPFPQRSTDPAKWVVPAYYWARVVNRSTKYPECAWEFVKFVASVDQMTVYSESTDVPPFRTDVDKELDLGNHRLRVFVDQIPYYQSWYKGDYEKADAAINTMINAVSVEHKSVESALQAGTDALNQELKEFN